MFKPGDKIVCVSDVSRKKWLAKGKVYTFVRYTSPVALIVKGLPMPHRAARFKKVVRQGTTPVKRLTNVR